jgi:8-oxo-dGTP diphosphatase
MPIKDPNAHKEKIKVVASVLIKNEEGKILSITVSDTDGHKINIPPGGRLDFRETLRQCAIREAKEEVNLDIKIDSIAGILEREYEDGFWTFILYWGTPISGTAINKEQNEIERIEYIDIEQLEDYDKINWIK